MNLLLLEHGEIDDSGHVHIAGRRASHLRTVLQSKPGDVLRVGVIRGGHGTARVLSAANDAFELRVSVSGEPVPPAVDLMLAVPRPKVLSRVVEAAAAIGVGRIDLVNAWRVDKAYFSSPKLQAAALRQAAVLGCEQGGSTWLPDIAVHPRLMPALEAIAPARHRGLRIVAHPRAAHPIESIVSPGHRGRVLVAVGPEGGWIDRELASFAAHQFSAVALGDSVLRVETAVTAVICQIALLQRLPEALPAE